VRRVLLAETHGPTRELVTRSLLDAGFEVLGATGAAQAYELYASQRPVAVVLGADFAGGAGASLATSLREADPRVLIVVADKQHMGKALGLSAVLPMKANAYVADPTGRELVEKIRHLVSQSADAHAALRGEALVLSRAPSARGDVRTGVVARLLHQIWRALSEGVLVVDEGGKERRVFFLRGAPVAFGSGDPAESLVGWLASGGRIDEAQRTAAVDGMASGLSSGAALIAAGVVEPGEALQAMLREHVRAMVVRAVGTREGRWRFHPGPEFAAEIAAVELPPLQLVLEGARAGIPAKHFADSLRAVMDAYPVRTSELQHLLQAASLSSADLRLALAFDGRTTTRQVLDARPKEFKDALSLLWFLSLVGVVVFQDDAVPNDGYGPTALPQRRKKPLPPDLAEALRQAAMRILPGTYFHALGVDIAADAAEVDRAHQEVSSRFHPDGFADWEVGDLQDLLAAVHDKVNAAHRVLGDDEKRRAYLSFLMQRFEAAGTRRPGIDVEAEIALKRGERALLSRRNAEAVTALKIAAERNAREPEYLAMLGFAELFDPVLPRNERAQEARKNARKALALAPDHPRASAVLALAEASLGDVGEGRRIVLDALKAHPHSEVLRRVLRRLNTPRA
jgi:DNA-binding NarL/FixJ family response regulator